MANRRIRAYGVPEPVESLRRLHWSGAGFLAVSAGVLLAGLFGFIWLMTLEPDYENVTCHGKPMAPEDECAVVTGLFVDTPGEYEYWTYEQMAEPRVPGSMNFWVCASLVTTGFGLWLTVTTVNGWKADLARRRRLLEAEARRAATPDPEG